MEFSRQESWSCCHFLLQDIFPTQGSNVRLFSLLQQQVDSIGLVLHGVFPGGSASKESTCNVGDLGSIPGLGRSPGEGNGYPLQYSGLENSMECIIHGVAELGVTEPFSLAPPGKPSEGRVNVKRDSGLDQWYNAMLSFGKSEEKQNMVILLMQPPGVLKLKLHVLPSSSASAPRGFHGAHISS